MQLTHRELCKIAAKYLRNQGLIPYQRCQYVVCELERVGESPDAFGWGAVTQLIEAKVSRSDFLSDKNKYWRRNPFFGLGSFRSYICPTDIIKISDLPNKWGLIYLEEKRLSIIKEPEIQECSCPEEIKLITSILRREGIRPKIFSYKNYKNDQLTERK